MGMDVIEVRIMGGFWNEDRGIEGGRGFEVM